MTDFANLLQGGNAWLFVPSNTAWRVAWPQPGHSKTMMAAFIIAVRGTVMQAVLLGLAATTSHTAIVWIIGLAGLHFGAQWNTEATEPYLEIVSAVLILGVAFWMLWRTWREQQVHNHQHHHDDEVRTIDTGHGVLTLEVFEDGVPPCRRIRSDNNTPLSVDSVTVETVRPDGARQSFDLSRRTGICSLSPTSPNRTLSRRGYGSPMACRIPASVSNSALVAIAKR